MSMWSGIDPTCCSNCLANLAEKDGNYRTYKICFTLDPGNGNKIVEEATVFEALSTVFSFKFLYGDGSLDLTSNHSGGKEEITIPLCLSCAFILKELYRRFQEFSYPRKATSLIAEKLDQIERNFMRVHGDYPDPDIITSDSGLPSKLSKDDETQTESPYVTENYTQMDSPVNSPSPQESSPAMLNEIEKEDKSTGTDTEETEKTTEITKIAQNTKMEENSTQTVLETRDTSNQTQLETTDSSVLTDQVLLKEEEAQTEAPELLDEGTSTETVLNLEIETQTEMEARVDVAIETEMILRRDQMMGTELELKDQSVGTTEISKGELETQTEGPILQEDAKSIGTEFDGNRTSMETQSEGEGKEMISQGTWMEGGEIRTVHSQTEEMMTEMEEEDSVVKTGSVEIQTEEKEGDCNKMAFTEIGTQTAETGLGDNSGGEGGEVRPRRRSKRNQREGISSPEHNHPLDGMIWDVAIKSELEENDPLENDNRILSPSLPEIRLETIKVEPDQSEEEKEVVLETPLTRRSRRVRKSSESVETAGPSWKKSRFSAPEKPVRISPRRLGSESKPDISLLEVSIPLVDICTPKRAYRRKPAINTGSRSNQLRTPKTETRPGPSTVRNAKSSPALPFTIVKIKTQQSFSPTPRRGNVSIKTEPCGSPPSTSRAGGRRSTTFLVVENLPSDDQILELKPPQPSAPFSCPDCKTSVYSLTNYRKHVEKHLFGHRFKCRKPKCEFTSRNFSNFKTHSERQHGTLAIQGEDSSLNFEAVLERIQKLI